MTSQRTEHAVEEVERAVSDLPIKSLLTIPFHLPFDLPGMALTTWRYLHTTRPMLHTRDIDVHGPVGGPDPDRELPGDPSAVKRRRDGWGPVYHRVYCLEIDDATMTPEQLVAAVLEDPNRASPTEVAVFHGRQPRGQEQDGSEFDIQLPGPWSAPVRVVEQTPTSFTFATLDGHMEAGQITFSARTSDAGRLVFTIESWARSGDPLFHLLYHRLWFGREVQMHMWVAFCLAAAKLAGGTPHDRVLVTTYRYVDGGV